MKGLMLAGLPAFILAVGGVAQAAAPAQPKAHHAAMHGTDGAHDRTARRETAALNLLEAKGYGDFKDFHADGRNFMATVTQQGRSFTVIINPDLGALTQQG